MARWGQIDCVQALCSAFGFHKIVLKQQALAGWPEQKKQMCWFYWCGKCQWTGVPPPISCSKYSWSACEILVKIIICVEAVIKLVRSDKKPLDCVEAEDISSKQLHRVQNAFMINSFKCDSAMRHVRTTISENNIVLLPGPFRYPWHLSWRHQGASATSPAADVAGW